MSMFLRGDTSPEAPGSGEVVAVHGGTPASTVPLGGRIEYLEVVESWASLPSFCRTRSRLGEPLIADGITLWMRGLLLARASGTPTAPNFDAMLARWLVVRDLFLLPNYELFTYYRPGASPAYRKYRGVATVLLRCWWHQPLGLVYELGATTGDKTLYTSAPGLG